MEQADLGTKTIHLTFTEETLQYDFKNWVISMYSFYFSFNLQAQSW